MKPFLGFGSLAAASAMVVAAAQPTLAAPTQVTGVDIKETSGGIELQLKTRFGDRPQVFSAPRGNSWVADVINTQLKLSGGSVFRQDNPAPGIAAVQILPLDENSIRIVVTGTETLPAGEVLARNNKTLAFGIKTDSGVAAVPAQPAAPITAQGQIAQPQGQQVSPPDVLVPNPTVTIEGEPAVQQGIDPAPPFLPRAVAPPVGDIAVSEIPFQPTNVDLGTAVRIPRLVLREAPAREVLALLARASGLNLAYSPAADSEGQVSASSEEGDEGPKISLDVENEPVQDVFNAVLRLSGLEANRVNNTIFVSPQLPNEVKDIVVRTYRLNQISSGEASAFLASMGAERVITQTTRSTEVDTQELGDGENAPELTTTRTIETQELTTDRVELDDSIPVLRGTQVLADERTNSVTIVGPRNLVAIASAKITELDLRKRQVAVNVRIVDINLSNVTSVGTSFTFGVAGNRFINEGGVALFNFDTSGQQGSRTPAQTTLTPQTVGQGVAGAAQSGIGFGAPGDGTNPATTVVRDFIAQLQANVQNGNAKVLTDPTVVVQEGETASVELTQEVVTNIVTTVDRDSGGSSTRTEIEKEDAGLTLAIQVDRIDDNGFINLSVTPSIRGIAGVQTFPGGTITLLNERRLTSGSIRLRDGQGLILSGIIQDTDRNTVSKVPLLGDLPILGSLFRRTVRDNSRNEVIVMVTPQVLDDSDRSTFGYAYVPSGDARRALDATTLR